MRAPGTIDRMPLTVAVLVTFICAAAGDELACRWHAARERRRVARGAAIAVMIELIGWVPALLAIDAIGEPVALAWIVIASVAGSVVGSIRGFSARDELPRAIVHTSKSRANLDG